MKIVYTPKHQLHNTDQVFVNNAPFITDEIPERAEILLDAIKKAKIGIVIHPNDHGIAPILAVHKYDFVEYLQHIFEENAAYYQEESPVFPETFATRPVRHKTLCLLGRKGYYCFGVGSPIVKGTWEATYWSAQCALTGADQLLDGQTYAYALCRPPGHHSAKDLYGGFCYLNNAAIAARHLGDHIAILDIDYHHGNGTQEIFYQDPHVLFCSIHAHPDDDYPYYWGSQIERGEGPGEGFNYNWPLPQKTGDTDYIKTLENALEIIVKFAPRYLIVSLGLDIADGDPVGGFKITHLGFNKIGKKIAQLSIPTLIVQEGGYLLGSLGNNAVAFLEAFS